MRKFLVALILSLRAAPASAHMETRWIPDLNYALLHHSGPVSGGSITLLRQPPPFAAQIQAAMGFLPWYATAALPTSCTNGQLVWDTTALAVKNCNANAWSAVAGGFGGTCSTANALVKATAATTLACASSVDNGTVITNTEVLQGPLGAVGTVAYGNSTNPNTGIYFPTGTTMSFSQNGADRVDLTGSSLSSNLPVLAQGHWVLANSGTGALVGGATDTFGFSSTAAGSIVASSVTDTSLARDHAGAWREITTAAAPTATSCGTSPSVAGNDAIGIITVGTTPSTTCTLVFTASYGAAPVCVAMDYNTAETIKGVPGTANWPMTFSATLTAADQIGYQCKRAN